MTYKLFVKTHNVTGLQFTGQTINGETATPVFWRNHCEIYGWDITTRILGEYETKNELEAAAWKNLIEDCNGAAVGPFNSLFNQEAV